MPDPLIFEPPDGASARISAKKPWERREGEPARWFMRFRNYLSMGARRSVNAVFEAERQEKAGKRSNKAGESWYGAARRYEWEQRAEFWDREQDEEKATLMRQIAMRCVFASRPFRLTQLNATAETLMRQLEMGHDPPTYLALARQLQSLMSDIREEVQAWNITIDASCDAAALKALQQKEQRINALQQERDQIAEEELDRKLVECLRKGLLPQFGDRE
jgi:hypothetical protein